MLRNKKYKFLRSLLDSKTVGVPVVIQTDLLDSKTVKLPVITQSDVCDSKTIKPSVSEQSEESVSSCTETLVNNQREIADISNVIVPAITQKDASESKTTDIPVAIRRGDSVRKTIEAPILNKKHDFGTETAVITLENVSDSRTATNRKDASVSKSEREFDINQKAKSSSRAGSDIKSDTKTIEERARNRRKGSELQSSEPDKNQREGSAIKSSEPVRNQREGSDIKSSEPVRNQREGSDIKSSTVGRVKQRGASGNNNTTVSLMNQRDSSENKINKVGVGEPLINQRRESSSWTIGASLIKQNDSLKKEPEEHYSKCSSYSKTTEVPVTNIEDRPGSNQDEIVIRTTVNLEEESKLPTLRISKPAPEFAGTALVNGELMKISLADFMGKYLILFFHPMDLSFVFPTEIIAFSDRVDELRALNCAVVICSENSGFSHLAWVNTTARPTVLDQIKVSILFDPTKVIHKSYSVIGDEGIAIRGLFIIDDKGCLRQININGMPVGINIDGIMRLVKAFQFVDKHGEVGPTWCEADSDPDKPDHKDRKVYFAKQSK